MKTIIAILALLCLGAIKPPVPKLPRAPIESPKGKEQRMAARVAPAAPRAIIVNNQVLLWNWTGTVGNPASNVVFVVHSSASLAAPLYNWPAIAICTTNGFPFVLSASIPSMFYHVQSSNIVSGMVSQ